MRLLRLVRNTRQEITVLKKAGIIVAGATVGVLAVTSFAFADTSKGNLKNDCAFGNATGDANSGIFGGDSLVGDVIAPITGLATQLSTQTNAGNCTNANVSDIFDSGSNNKSDDKSETKVEHSFNQED